MPKAKKCGDGPGKGRKEQAAKRREARWRRIVGDQLRSGLSQAAYCRKHALNANTLAWWKTELQRRDASRDRRKAERSSRATKKSATLVPVRVVGGAGEVGGEFELKLSNDRVLRIPSQFDAEALERLLAVLER